MKQFQVVGTPGREVLMSIRRPMLLKVIREKPVSQQVEKVVEAESGWSPGWRAELTGTGAAGSSGLGL